MAHRLRSALAAGLLIGATPLLGACFWLAVGGAGAVGYEVAKDDRSIGTKVDDASITTSVKAKLVRDAEIQAIEINVDTFEGVVTLHGSVPSARAASRAEALARSVKGVRDVDSKLVVVAPASN